MDKERICGIYCIENKVNGKKYIGQSINIDKRWSDHKYRLKKDIHENKYLQRSYNKYGKESFEFYIVKLITKDKLGYWEEFFIKKSNSANCEFGYNSTSGGEVGYEWNKEKMKNYKKARATYIVKLSKNGELLSSYSSFSVANLEHGLRERSDNIRACCKNQYGRKTYLGFCWMYANDYIKNGFSIENYEKTTNAKPIEKIDKNTGEILKTYKSARSATTDGFKYKNISQVCNGEKKTHLGFIWRFAK